jgi:hypothetical protein
MQTEITQPGPLLNSKGQLVQTGWARSPLLDCNLENARFYPGLLRPLQPLRKKRWDYYAIFTPRRFFSATIAHLGYAGNIFVYTLDFERGDLHEEGVVIPLGKGIQLPRNSQEGEAFYRGKDLELVFQAHPGHRTLSVSWPAFHSGRGIHAKIRLDCPADHESMNIVIPIEKQRFYWNHKINCLPASGFIQYGEEREELNQRKTLGSLDWGRGVWAYRSFWNWASASGFLPDGRAVGLNLGSGFGDTSAATENCLILQGRIHKLDQVSFNYTRGNYMGPWRFCDNSGRLDLTFTPFKDRLARTNLGVIFSEVHQMFGYWSGTAAADDGEVIQLQSLIGFAEEHHARW